MPTDPERAAGPLRVLITAFACDPTRGSEPGVGWAWSCAAARGHAVTLMTGEWNRERIEAHVGHSAFEAIEYVQMPSPGIPGRLPVAGEYARYARWQRAAASRARELHTRRPFDVVHHLTYGSCWMPSHLHTVGAPFVFGPAGGAERVPASLLRSLPPAARGHELARVGMQAWARRSRGLRTCVAGASVCLAKTEESAAYLRGAGASRVERCSELSLPPMPETRAVGAAGSADDVHCLFVGRLQHFKGVHLAIQAFALVAGANGSARMSVIGEGAARSALEALARRLGVQDRVTFTGALAREQVLGAMRTASVLVHPTLHDSSGNVLVEAMACGLPVVCLDIGGPRAILPDAAGIRVSPSGLADTVRDLADAVMRVTAPGGGREAMAAAALSHAQDVYGADAFEQRIARVYRRAASGGEPAVAGERA